MNKYMYPLPPLIREAENTMAAARLICPVPGYRVIKEWRGYICFIEDIYEPEYTVTLDDTGERHTTDRKWAFKHRTEVWIPNYHNGPDHEDCEICKKYEKFWKKYKQPKNKVILSRKKLKELLNA